MNALILIIMWFVSFGAVVWSVVTRRNHDDIVRRYVVQILQIGVEIGGQAALTGEHPTIAECVERFEARMGELEL